MTRKEIETEVDRLMTVNEAAVRLNVRAGWFYQHLFNGTLPMPFVRVGRYIRISAAALEEYIARSTSQPAGPGPQLRSVK